MRSFILVFCLLFASHATNSQELRGHGGPVRALALHTNGKTLLSSSFDSATLLWDLTTGKATKIFRAHESAVNVNIWLDEARFVTGGEDGQLIFWDMNVNLPQKILKLHEAPIVALAVSPDKQHIATASWDGKVKLIARSDYKVTTLDEAKANVNGIILNETELLAITYDGKIIYWDFPDLRLKEVRTIGFPLNSITQLPNKTLLLGTSEGKLIILPQDQPMRTLEVQSAPILSIAVSPNSQRLALSGIQGSVTLLHAETYTPLFRLEGPGLPVWSLRFRNNEELLTGGSDRLIRRWDMRTGEHLGAVTQAIPSNPTLDQSHGAQVYKACVACHTLKADEGERAGPTLHQIIGRTIGTLPNYTYSPNFKAKNIVWSKETIAKLFEIGPNAYLPGTKMPEQRVINAQDREALVEYISIQSR